MMKSYRRIFFESKQVKDMHKQTIQRIHFDSIGHSDVKPSLYIKLGPSQGAKSLLHVFH